MSAETFITEKLDAYKDAMADFERIQSFIERRATDSEGFARPLRLDEQRKIEAAATVVRDRLRDLVL